jgi:hypothetical protein
MKLADIIAERNREWVASYIENGGDLSELSQTEREELARIVRGSTGERSRQICCEIAYLIGTGMPAYTDSGKFNPSPVVESDAEDACTVIAQTRGLEPDYVRKIWSKRTEDKILEMLTAFGKRIADKYRSGDIEPPSKNELELSRK